MWLAGTRPSSTFGSAEVHMDPPGRLFLCARCRVQVVLCSHCDRGNRYCGRSCRRMARDAARRESARRYQRSRRGRLAHAERSRRWRQRRDVHEGGDGGDGGGGRKHKVTHQGCPPGSAAAPLVAWTSPTATPTSMPKLAPEPEPEPAHPHASVSIGIAATLPGQCRRCARPLHGWVRQGFLRHVLHRAQPRRRHDHSP